MNNDELLSAAIIKSALTSVTKMALNDITVFKSIGSTNQYLLEQLKNNSISGRVCLAEQQTQGRGRRGKSWISPSAQNIYLSVSWRFTKPLTQLNGLSLVIGLALVAALEQLGIERLGIKWPNDVFYQQKKLAGILIETMHNTSDSCTAVIGIGLNVNMQQTHAIDQNWTSIANILQENQSRNDIIAILLNLLFKHLSKFNEQGFSAWFEQWKHYDLIYHKTVEILQADTHEIGIAQGVSRQGELIVEINKQIKYFTMADISVREML